MRTSSSAPNVWPGYVGATAALAITLLLLIGFLGTNLFVLGKQTARVLHAAGEISEQVTRDLPPPRSDSSRGQAVSAEPLASIGSREAPPPVAPWRADGASAPGALAPVSAAALASTPAWRIVLSFEKSAYLMDTATRAALRDAVAPVADRPLLVEGLTDGELGTASARAAYLRVMAVRNALLDAGIDPDRIRPSVRAVDAVTLSGLAERPVVISLAPRMSDKELPHAR